MNKYKIKITETYTYYIDIEAKSKKEAIEKAKEYYENESDGYTGVPDACTLEKTGFNLVREKR